MMIVEPSILLDYLRAAGEPSRLRLLVLCADATLSVSDFAQALKQSEARVSRHLKILCEAGLIERLPQGQWVHYRMASTPHATSFVRGLLAQLDRRDPQLLRDASAARAAASPDASGSSYGGESRLGRALAGFLSAQAPDTPLDRVLVVGVMHPELLEGAARIARHCMVLTPSRRAAQAVRACAERRGFACVVLPPSGSAVPGPEEFARAGSKLDAVLLDHPPPSGEALGPVLESAARVLAPGGRLWVFEPYESLESSRERIVEHPLARLRRLLSAAGLSCERLGPVEADGKHVLAALARLAEAAQRPLPAAGMQQ
jgi:DNA-binding transcriptional ArsR family regulator